jgi:hypothetical protein
MEIKPEYVTFEQAKWLKEKGLIANCKRYWVKYSNTEYKEMSDIQLEDLDREIGIGSNLIIPKYEQWQVVEWFRVNHGIWISVDMVYETTQTGFWYSIRQSKEDDKAICSNDYPTPQEAYSAAFDYILNNNLI